MARAEDLGRCAIAAGLQLVHQQIRVTRAYSAEVSIMLEHHVQVLEYNRLCSLQLCSPAVVISRPLVCSAGLQVTKQHHQALQQRKQLLS